MTTSSQRAGMDGESRQEVHWKMVREDPLSSSGMQHGRVRLRRRAGVIGKPSKRTAHEAFTNERSERRAIVIGIWVVPRECILSSHDGREFFAFLTKIVHMEGNSYE